MSSVQLKNIQYATLSVFGVSVDRTERRKISERDLYILSYIVSFETVVPLCEGILDRLRTKEKLKTLLHNNEPAHQQKPTLC